MQKSKLVSNNLLTTSLLFLILIFTSCSSSEQSPEAKKMKKTNFKKVDWQGHRGARGLLPENSIPAFIKALDYVSTLELDVVVSKDKQIIVSHEPWFSDKICSHPDGSPVTEQEAESLLIYEMDYEEIKKYDCGKRGNPRFEEQQAMAAFKPSFMEMVGHVDLYCQENGLPKPFFNVEMKSYKDWYGKRIPMPAEFVQLMLNEIKLLDIHQRVNLQSFDIKVLQEIRKVDKEISMALLVENLLGVEENINQLGFIPKLYSPYYMLLNEQVINEIHDKGMELVPWTVNDPEVMKKLVALGCDGIITDYPNLIPQELK